MVIRRTLTVDDQAIVMIAESTPEHNGNRDGSIMAEAQLLPVAYLTEPLDKEEFPASEGWTTPVWQASDLASGSLSSGILSGLRSGWHQVAVERFSRPSKALR